MKIGRWPASRTLAQLSLVWALSGTFLLACDFTGFRSGWNMAWIIAIPFGTARLFDRGFKRGDGIWPLIGLYLLVWSWIATGATAVLFGVGL